MVPLHGSKTVLDLLLLFVGGQGVVGLNVLQTLVSLAEVQILLFESTFVLQLEVHRLQVFGVHLPVVDVEAALKLVGDGLLDFLSVQFSHLLLAVLLYPAGESNHVVWFLFGRLRCFAVC